MHYLSDTCNARSRLWGHPAPPACERRPASRTGVWLGVIACASLVLMAYPAEADFWYEHYYRAEEALEDENWTLAVQELNEALGKKGDSGARVRSYGMKVTPYFPYLKLGIAYYRLGQFDAALQAFETELRLGAIAQSDAASAELESFRELVQAAREAAAADAQQRIAEIVGQSLDDARNLEESGLYDEAIAALDQALAVAPDDVRAQDVMNQLRQKLSERTEQLASDRRATALVEQGRALLRERQYSEASSLFREALSVKPDAAVEALLDDTQDRLLAELEAVRGLEDDRAVIVARLEEVRRLEAAGELAGALQRLQSVLAMEPANPEAATIQGRLLQARKQAETENARRADVARLLTEARSRFEAGSAEDALSAANRLLALDPGNSEALKYVSQAYAMISQRLLGTGPRGNIPPAVRFVDLRQEDSDGMLVQTIKAPDFRLNGVIIDNSPVEVVFYGDDEVLKPDLSSQPLGEFFITEFNLEARLRPGRSSYRLVATDSDKLVSSSEYAVVYVRPVYRAPWFYGLVLGSGVALLGAFAWRRDRRRRQLRKRRFNPYVAGAPVLEDDMFFGRRELVDRILQTIHNNSLLIYGERRIGKTSIQHQLKKRLHELDDPDYKFYPVYVDLQGTPETRFFQTIAEDIFEELAPLLKGLRPRYENTAEYSYRDFVRDVHAVLMTLKKGTARKIKLVLLIDEVDALNDYDPRINQKLRSLFMKSFAESLTAVVSGVQIKKHWEREGSPWYNFFEEIQVAPLSPHEARELIERPIRGVFKLDDGTAERIISLTGGRPYLIQKLCVALVTRLHEQRRRRITIEDVEAVDLRDASSGIENRDADQRVA